MAAPKTTDLSTVDQLSTLKELHDELQNIIVELNSIRSVLQLYSLIINNVDIEIESGIKLIKMLDPNEDLLSEIISNLHFSLKKSIDSVCDLNENVEGKIFKLEGRTC